jgi:isopentenyl diphosphate isomerase/L-lactate dehydrogenase-like FMN-dependent dehydrogenase
MARRKLPIAVKDYIEGGAEDEITVGRNRESFRAMTFSRRSFVDVSTRDLTTTLLGTPVAAPLGLCPVGLAATAHPKGEKASSMAAASRGLLATLASGATWNIEEVAAASDGPKWFQLYIWRDRGITRSIVERAQAAGYQALVLTVDVAVPARRERDLHNGFEIPPKPTLRHTADVLRHVAWFSRLAWDETFGHGLTMGNFAPTEGIGKRVNAMKMVSTLFDPSVTWKDLEWLQSIWKGPIVVKGITNGADAKQSIKTGAAALWVSNHGGRQLDGLSSSLDMLEPVLDAVASDVEVYLDGGVRRGSDVLKAVALGARACMIGRPYMYGLAAGGQAGVERVLDLMLAEMDAALALLGCTSIAELDRSFLIA